MGGVADDPCRNRLGLVQQRLVRHDPRDKAKLERARRIDRVSGQRHLCCRRCADRAVQEPRATRRRRQSQLDEAFGEFRLFRRSEEHTSELQSLMRISYAVFCLKNKTTDTTY